MQNFARLWLCSLSSLFKWKEISEGILLKHLTLWLLIWNSTTLLRDLKPSKVTDVKQACWDTVHSRKKTWFCITLMSPDWSRLRCGLSTGWQFPWEHLCLFWCGILHRLSLFQRVYSIFMWKFIIFVISSFLGSSRRD